MLLTLSFAHKSTFTHISDLHVNVEYLLVHVFYSANLFVVFDPTKHDDSLTNIQWLGLMSGENLVNRQREETIAMANRDIRIIASDKQIEKVCNAEMSINV